MKDFEVKVPNGCQHWKDCFTCPFRDCVASSTRGRTAEERARTYTAVYSRNQRQTRKAAGLCVTCGMEPPAPGHVTCERCLAIHRKKDEARRASRTEKAKDKATAEP